MEKANEKVFGMYSEYYDLLYRDKDYVAETDYVATLLNRFMPEAKNLVDLGCGTGKHAVEFAKRGYKVTGIEMSESMLNIAKNNLPGSGIGTNDVKYICGDISKIQTGEKYDAAMALFHVMGYLTENSQILKGIRNIASHLTDGGLLIFDYWYGPAVLSQKPEKRSKLLKGNGLVLRRNAEPELLINENIVEVNYNIEAKAESGEVLQLDEKHSMRYFFLPEIKLLLDQCGFRVLLNEEWMTGKELSEESWSGVCVAKLDSEKK